MEKRLIPLSLLVLGLGVYTPTLAVANVHKEMSPAEREKALNDFASELNLTQDQKNKVRDIKEEKHRKMEEIRTDYRRKVRDVLTADQQKRFDQINAKKAN